MPDRVYLPYWRWEDYADGMYAIPWNMADEMERARDLLADPGRLKDSMGAVVDSWPNATSHQLTNLEQNRRAWIGQAACRLAVKATAVATRAAWWQLTDPQRDAANAAADSIIREWEEANDRAQTLFG